MTYKLLQGDVFDKLAEIESGTVQTCVTSPPYWGLRDYGIEPSIWGGDPECAHEWTDHVRPGMTGGTNCKDVGGWAGGGVGKSTVFKEVKTAFCSLCGAWRGCYGLEPTPEMYVRHTVEIFREVRRVLRDDGTLWLNLGDSYASGGMSNPSSKLTLVGGKDLGAADYFITR